MKTPAQAEHDRKNNWASFAVGTFVLIMLMLAVMTMVKPNWSGAQSGQYDGNTDRDTTQCQLNTQTPSCP